MKEALYIKLIVSVVEPVIMMSGNSLMTIYQRCLHHNHNHPLELPTESHFGFGQSSKFFSVPGCIHGGQLNYTNYNYYLDGWMTVCKSYHTVCTTRHSIPAGQVNPVRTGLVGLKAVRVHLCWVEDNTA